MYTEQEIEEYFISPLIASTQEACKINGLEGKERILVNSGGVGPLFSKQDLEKLSQYLKATLKLYKRYNFSEEDIERINSLYFEETDDFLPSKNTSIRLVDLYLMQNTVTKDLKIGISNDLERRKRDLQNTNGRQIEILYVIPQKSNLELTLHEKFSHLRLMGEWFKYDKSIIDEFEKLLDS